MGGCIMRWSFGHCWLSIKGVGGSSRSRFRQSCVSWQGSLAAPRGVGQGERAERQYLKCPHLRIHVPRLDVKPAVVVVP